MTQLDSGEVWHYTSAAGLIGIVTSHRLWASSAACMNDENEMRSYSMSLRAALEHMKDSLSELEMREGQNYVDAFVNDVPDIFLVSASRNPDLLTLWRSYGSGQMPGYAVGLDSSVTLGPSELVRPESGSSSANAEGGEETVEAATARSVMSEGWTDVEYRLRADERLEAELWEEIRRRTADLGPNVRARGRVLLRNLLRDGTTLFKDEAFKDEREVRFVTSVGPRSAFVRYRPGIYGTTPYVELGSGVNENGYVPVGENEKLPILRVMIGPNSHRTEEEPQIVRALLDDNGYSEASVEVSRIPYR